ncbi:hypothetical protein ACOSQ2_005294 [Xanthoceras sorbifolium]
MGKESHPKNVFAADEFPLTTIRLQVTANLFPHTTIRLQVVILGDKNGPSFRNLTTSFYALWCKNGPSISSGILQVKADVFPMTTIRLEGGM